MEPDALSRATCRALLPDSVQDAFTIARLISLFSTFETAEQAAASFAAPERVA